MKGWITLTRSTDRTKVYVQSINIANVCQYYKGDCTVVTFIGSEDNYMTVLESPDAVMNLIRSSYEDT